MGAFQPPDWPTVAARLFTDDVEGLVAFLRAVLGAEGEAQGDRPAEMRLGDSVIMVSGGGGIRQPSSGFLYVYVADTDAAYARAMATGSTEIEPPADMPYGDRRATVRDPWGNTWQIATWRG